MTEQNKPQDYDEYDPEDLIPTVEITLNMDRKRIARCNTVETVLLAEEGDGRALLEVVGSCVWDPETNRFKSKKEGRGIVGQMSFEQLQDTMTDISKTLNKDTGISPKPMA